MSETMVPDTLRICELCGDVASAQICESCERLADEYDGRYHAHRAHQLFSSLPRETPVDDGLGAMRGAAVALKIYTVLMAAVLVGGFLLGWFS